jgi:hypothetical protein
MRKRAKGQWIVFTKVGGQLARYDSLQELVLKQPNCRALIISHTLNILWNDTVHKATLYEILSPSEKKSGLVTVKLRLEVNDKEYETEECDSLTEARRHLVEISSPVTFQLQICADCCHSWPAVTGPGWDDRDELACYRDAPDAEAELVEKGKFASDEAAGAGEFFVNAFHSCAAWQGMGRSEEQVT